MARLNEPPIVPAAPSSHNAPVEAATATETLESRESTLLVLSNHNAIYGQVLDIMRTKSKPVIEKPPTDLEEVKRRFIRQNRELAKNNSSQSLRIRSLENEVSKLLADNLDLREQILGLQHEVYDAKSKSAGDAITRMKNELRRKIVELSGLVEGFQEGEKAERTRPAIGNDKATSPSERQYRERQPLAELLQDVIMPTITEDKSYPRRTLDAAELRAIRLSDQSGASGSPDIGPPPVAHFEFRGGQETAEEGPIFEPLRESEESSLPSINLETRRKRKDGGSNIASRRHSIAAPSPAPEGDDEISRMLRTGAKRKLADRETEKPIKPPSQGDFTFSRKASAPVSVPAGSEAMTAELTLPESAQDEKCVPLPPTKPVRKVLGEKSVNASPRKAEAKSVKPFNEELKKPVPPKVTSSSGRPASRGRRASLQPGHARQEEANCKVHDIELAPASTRSTAHMLDKKQSNQQSLAPSCGDLATSQTVQVPLAKDEELDLQTPAFHEIFSPITEPSAKAGESCDTPPPANLSTSSNTTEGGQRPSRRARSAVNYAEPSLIAKMRRPDKQMVDAISGIRDPRLTMSHPADRRTSTGSTTSARTVVIKQESDNGESAWKDVPHISDHEEMNSPLQSKTTDRYSGSSGSTTPKNVDLEDEQSMQCLSTNLTSAEAAGSRKPRQQLQRGDHARTLGQDAITLEKLDELDLYDFKDSSSPAAEAQSKPSSAANIRVSHRRHSSMPKNVESGDLPQPVSSGRVDRTANRRRSMML